MQIYTKLKYYLQSVLKIINGFSNPFSVLFFFFQKPHHLDAPSHQVQLKKTGLKFQVRTPMDVWSIKETFLDDFYRFARYAGSKNGTIIDIGAGIGEFAIQAAAACPDCTIIGFEPFHESYTLFHQNIALNGLKNINPVEAAVTSFSGTMVLDISSGNPLQYRIQTGSPAGHTKGIKSVGLIDFMNAQGIQNCDFLKLDCEGGEYDILLNLSAQDMGRFSQIVMEYHDSLTAHTHQELEDHLKSSSFRVEVVPNQVHSDLGYIYAQNDKNQ